MSYIVAYSSISIAALPVPLTQVTITSTNTNSGYAKVGDLINIFIKSNININIGNSSIAGERGTISWSTTNRKLLYTVHEGSMTGIVQHWFWYVWVDGVIQFWSYNYPMFETNDKSFVIIDTLAPRLTNTSIKSNNTNSNSFAKVGDIVTLSFFATESLQKPMVTIMNQPATVLQWSWTTQRNATINIVSWSSNGQMWFSINYADLAGNTGNTSMATTDSSSIIVDTILPILTGSNTLIPYYTSTPKIIIHASETATITYSGRCLGDQVWVISWLNTITFNNLTENTYNQCSVSIRDMAWNISNSILLPNFIVDKITPIVTLSGATNIILQKDTPYIEHGAHCSDNIDTACTMTISWNVNVSIPGIYLIQYISSDLAGNITTLSRTITITAPLSKPTGLWSPTNSFSSYWWGSSIEIDTTSPTVSLKGNKIITLTYWEPYVELWISCTDNNTSNNDLFISTNSSINPTKAWTYTVSYICTDKSKNTTTIKRTVIVQEQSTMINNPIFNISITDGYCYKRKSIYFIIDSQTEKVVSEEFKKALSMLYAYDMTMYNTVDEFGPYRRLSRQEAAKILSNFAINVLCRKPNEKLKTYYSDTQEATPTLKPYITLAYQLGIMKWWTDSNFKPTEAITKVELNAVIIRLILQGYLSESWEKRYTEYNKVSKTLGIIKQSNSSIAISRSDAAIMMFRAYKNQTFSLQTLKGYESFALKDRSKHIK